MAVQAWLLVRAVITAGYDLQQHAFDDKVKV